MHTANTTGVVETLSLIIEQRKKVKKNDGEAR